MTEKQRLEVLNTRKRVLEALNRAKVAAKRAGCAVYLHYEPQELVMTVEDGGRYMRFGTFDNTVSGGKRLISMLDGFAKSIRRRS